MTHPARVRWNDLLHMRVQVLERYCGDSGYEESQRTGNGICTECGFEYVDHPMDGPRGYDGNHFLHRLCDGRLVKL